MLLLYNLFIQLYGFFVLIASLKSNKAKSWIKGRKDGIKLIEQKLDKKVLPIWFHFASLGEFEQGRPVIEELKAKDPDTSIIITFFSPSGYEVRKDYPLADHVFYLPLDTEKNAKEFIRIVRPRMAIFTKYEYWYHYFNELHKNNIPLFIISAIFRKEQPFFKWYGGLHRKMLKMVSSFFVQNKTSAQLLSTLGVGNVIISGDTRFDRVYYNALHVRQLNEIENFCGGKNIFIAGSTWLDDEKLITILAIKNPDWKFIVAPHEVNTKRIMETETIFKNSVKYSEIRSGGFLEDRQILIIDNIGILSSLYQYGSIAYIGGGFGVGIHNTLEAAAFGIPVIFGPNYGKFMEARELIQAGAAFTIKDQEELNHCMENLQNDDFRIKSGNAAKQYVSANTGATKQILNYIEANKA